MSRVIKDDIIPCLSCAVLLFMMPCNFHFNPRETLNIRLFVIYINLLVSLLKLSVRSIMISQEHSI